MENSNLLPIHYIVLPNQCQFLPNYGIMLINNLVGICYRTFSIGNMCKIQTCYQQPTHPKVLPNQYQISCKLYNLSIKVHKITFTRDQTFYYHFLKSVQPDTTFLLHEKHHYTQNPIPNKAYNEIATQKIMYYMQYNLTFFPPLRKLSLSVLQ